MEDFKIEGRNAVIELLKSDKTVNKVMIQKGERQGSINEIISFWRSVIGMATPLKKFLQNIKYLFSDWQDTAFVL